MTGLSGRLLSVVFLRARSWGHYCSFSTQLTSMMLWRRWVLHLTSLLMTFNFICPVDLRTQWCAHNKCIVHLRWCMTGCLPIVLDSTRLSHSLYGSVQDIHVVGLMPLHQHPLVDR